MKSLVLSAFLVISTFSFGIYNGVPGSQFDYFFPAVVKLVNSNDYFCTGTFITKRVLLTATHCLSNVKDGGIQIFKTNTRSKKVAVHEDHADKIIGKETVPSTETKWDLAIVLFDEDAHAATMRVTQRELYRSSPVILTGFGKKDPNEKSGLNAERAELLVGHNNIYTREDENRIISISATQDLATTDGSNSAYLPGDSGGPLLDMDTKEIIGVASSGVKSKTEKKIYSYAINLRSRESIQLLKKANTLVENIIPQEIINRLEGTEVAQAEEKPANSETTPGTASPAPAQNAIKKVKVIDLQSSDLIRLSDEQSKEISEAFNLNIKAGVYYTPANLRENRFDLHKKLLQQTIISKDDKNPYGFFRIGYSPENADELWLTTARNHQFLLYSKNKSVAPLAENAKSYIITKTGLVYFDANWQIYYVSYDQKTKFDFNMRAYTRPAYDTKQEAPLYSYDAKNNRIILVNCKQNLEDNTKTPEEAEAEIQVFGFSGDQKPYIYRLKDQIYWPFLLQPEALITVANNSQFYYQRFRFSDFNYLENAKVLAPKISTYQIQATSTGQMFIYEPNANLESAKYSLTSEGKLIPNADPRRFQPVADAQDQLIEALPLKPKARDLYEFPWSVPLYQNTEIEKFLLSTLSSNKNNLAILIYEEGQKPSEPVKAFLHKIKNGDINPPPALRRLERAWLIPSEKLFNRTEVEMSSQLEMLLKAADNRRAILYLEDFPTTRQDLAESTSTVFENIWSQAEQSANQGKIRIIFSIKKNIYQLLQQKYPDILKRIAVYEVPKLNSDVTKSSFLKLKAQLEEEYGKSFSVESFKSFSNIYKSYSENIESPEREERILRKFMDWYALQHPDSPEIMTNNVSEFVNNGLARTQKFSSEHFRKYLKQKMVGQEEAIEQIVKAFMPLETGITDSEVPIYFVLIGPPGVGKTRISNLIADYLTGPNSNVLIDFKELQDWGPEFQKKIEPLKSSANKLKVVTFDDIDRANFNDFDRMRGILDQGYYARGTSNEISFKNTILIMTANWGQSLILQNSKLPDDFMEKLRRDIVNEEEAGKDVGNPRGKISMRVWRVLSSKIYTMFPFTESQLLELAERFTVEELEKVHAKAPGKEILVHPNVYLRHLSVKKAASAGASDIKNSWISSDFLPKISGAIGNSKVHAVLLVPGPKGTEAVTNLDPAFQKWLSFTKNAQKLLKEKGADWYLKNHESAEGLLP